MYYIDQYGQMLRGNTISWIVEKHGIDEYGRVDCCWRTGIAAVAYGDLRLIFALLHMLSARKRYLGPPLPVIKGKVPFVKQTDFTRDQTIMACAGLYLNGYITLLRDIKIPIILSRAAWLRPSTYWWINALKYGKKKYEKRYIRWALIDLKIAEVFGMPTFGYHLIAWMNYCIPNEKVAAEILKKTPAWNLLLRKLCGENIPIKEAEAYRSISYPGYIWQRPEFPEYREYTPDEAPYKLDKDVLIAIYNKKTDMKKGTRVKLTGLPTGSGLSRSLIGRTGTIISITDYSNTVIKAIFYSVNLDPKPRERTEKVINGLSADKIEKI